MLRSFFFLGLLSILLVPLQAEALVCRLIQGSEEYFPAKNRTFSLRTLIVNLDTYASSRDGSPSVLSMSMDKVEPWTACHTFRSEHGCSSETVSIAYSYRGPDRVQVRMDSAFLWKDHDVPEQWRFTLNRAWIDEHQFSISEPTIIKDVEKATALYRCE